MRGTVRDFYCDAIERGAGAGLFLCISYRVDEDWTQQVLIAGSPRGVVPRVIGPRQDLYEIPLPEVGAHIRHMKKLLTGGGSFSLYIAGLSDDEFLRRVLETYGVQRLTRKARMYMAAAKNAELDSDMRAIELKHNGERSPSHEGPRQER